MKRWSLLMLGVALTFSSPPVDAQTALRGSVPAPAVTYTPERTPSVLLANPNADENAWKRYRTRRDAPSTDQGLTDPILTGAIDIHAHFGPDVYQRQWDAFEIARLAKARGMRGVVIKNHWTETASTAAMVRKYADVAGLEIFGGLALNTTVGGINPQAVRYFAEIEGRYGKIVWMPTHDSENEVKYRNEQRPYVRVSDGGRLLPQVLEVLDLIKRYDLTLATGHVYPREMLQIVQEAQKRGIKRIVVTHPNLGPMFTDATRDELNQAVAMGAVIEVVASSLRRPLKASFVETIRTIGPRHVIVATDSGITGTPNHPDALVGAIRYLRDEGFSEADLDLMFRKNPATLLGLTNR